MIVHKNKIKITLKKSMLFYRNKFLSNVLLFPISHKEIDQLLLEIEAFYFISKNKI